MISVWKTLEQTCASVGCCKETENLVCGETWMRLIRSWSQGRGGVRSPKAPSPHLICKQLRWPPRTAWHSAGDARAPPAVRRQARVRLLTRVPAPLLHLARGGAASRVPCSRLWPLRPVSHWLPPLHTQEGRKGSCWERERERVPRCRPPVILDLAGLWFGWVSLIAFGLATYPSTNCCLCWWRLVAFSLPSWSPGFLLISCISLS